MELNDFSSVFQGRCHVWAVTGAAGFIGSHLVEKLLLSGQKVVGVDNFTTGKQSNLIQVRGIVGEERWANFSFHQGDIRDQSALDKSFSGANFVLHHAAFASVPGSIENPIECFSNNVDGFVRVLESARKHKVKRVVYASSSSVYGNDPLPAKKEEQTSAPLSPYALTKKLNEEIAESFRSIYGMESVGLRYFNVYGPRQAADGPYAAVVPVWIEAIVRGEKARIYGDGRTSRDFCSINDVFVSNVLAALVPGASGQVFNIGSGVETSLNELYLSIQEAFRLEGVAVTLSEPEYLEERKGDIRQSLADISKARRILGFQPKRALVEGLREIIRSESTEPSFASKQKNLLEGRT